MENILIDLFKAHFGAFPNRIEALPASGSARKYYRIWSQGVSYIGAYHQDAGENRLFIAFSGHFKNKGLHVPEIYCVSEDLLAYVQEDLGSVMLLDVVEKEREGNRLSPHLMVLYKKALSELLRFQLLGDQGFDYSRCIPRAVFDRRCILWDLNYFKYCFLRLAGAVFSEEALEDDFEQLVTHLCQVDTHSFMFRDFQSRNIMVREDEVWFIDYQGGRQGALHYDVASLLYDAIAGISDEQREYLLNGYILELQRYRDISADEFCRDYYHFVLIRLLQALGAFGLRGLYEQKAHFIASIRPGIQSVLALFETGRLGDRYPEIRRALQSCRMK